MIWLSVNRDFFISVDPFRWKKFYFLVLRIFGGITKRQRRAAMILVLVFVGATIWPYPVWSTELPHRRCNGRQVSQELRWLERPALPKVRTNPFKRAGRG
jgi:hypothetical protein